MSLEQFDKLFDLNSNELPKSFLYHHHICQDNSQEIFCDSTFNDHLQDDQSCEKSQQVQKKPQNQNCRVENKDLNLGTQSLTQAQIIINPKKLTRRKKADRQISRRLNKKSLKQSTCHLSQGEANGSLSQVTKNILANGKTPVLKYFQKVFGSGVIESNSILKKINSKQGMVTNDYHQILRSQELRDVLKEFCKKKILYRQLMISRVTYKNRIRSLYYFDAIERNILSGCFLGLTKAKIQIEAQKCQKKQK